MVKLNLFLIAILTMAQSQAQFNASATWSRIIRFRDTHNITHYGEPQVNSGDEVIPAFEGGTLKAVVLQCDRFVHCSSKRGATLVVKELLSPLTARDVPIVRCMALNYRSHIDQNNGTIPPFPSEFIKGRTAVNQWDTPIPVPTIAENNSTDFEGELSFVVSRDAKDIPRSEVLSYIGGFFVGNDVSNRKWQLNASFAGTQPQFDFSKGFDGWAPYGPVIVSPSIVGAANNLTLTTTVNGELRQNASTSQLIFDVVEILHFLSQGTTVEAGTVIMTGTPAGTGLGTGRYIHDGDIVQVNITGLGYVKNQYIFQTQKNVTHG